MGHVPSLKSSAGEKQGQGSRLCLFGSKAWLYPCGTLVTVTGSAMVMWSRGPTRERDSQDSGGCSEKRLHRAPHAHMCWGAHGSGGAEAVVLQGRERLCGVSGEATQWHREARGIVRAAESSLTCTMSSASTLPITGRVSFFISQLDCGFYTCHQKCSNLPREGSLAVIQDPCRLPCKQR